MTNEKIRIGKIVGCHGLKGELKVNPTSARPAWIGQLDTVYLSGPEGLGDADETLSVTAMRAQGNLVMIRLSGIEDRTRAETFVGKLLYTDADILEAPDEGEFWVDDLIGMTVIDGETGRLRGSVKDVLSSGGTDFLEIQIEGVDETLVAPFIDHFFPDVDAETRRITMNLLNDLMPEKPITADTLEQ